MVKELTSEKKAKGKPNSQAVALKERVSLATRQFGKSGRLFTCQKTDQAKLYKFRLKRRPAATAAKGNERLLEMEAYNATLRKRVVDLQAQIHKLKQEKGANPLDASLHDELQNLQGINSDLQAVNADLREQIAKLKEEVQSAAKSVNIAWQQGYLAGQLSAQEEAAQQQKGFIETLAEAAQAATAYGAGQQAPPPSATATAAPPAEQITSPVGQEAPYVAETPAYLSEALQDPDVMNDPFTARLLDALHTEFGGETEAVPALNIPFPQPEHSVPIEFEDVSAVHTAPQFTPDMALTQPSAPSDPFNCEPDGVILEQHVSSYTDSNLDGMKPEPESQQQDTDADAEEAGEEMPDFNLPDEEVDTSGFTADELHNLFRNKYVRPDEPLAASDPSVSGTFPTFKKFVGTNKTATDPLPTAPRSFPPEIRKACKLLGLNPEELSKTAVNEAWKKEMAKPGVHPDTGGDTEMAIYLNTAKDTLMRWIEGQTPKLGKKFGAGQQQTKEQSKPQQKNTE